MSILEAFHLFWLIPFDAHMAALGVLHLFQSVNVP